MANDGGRLERQLARLPSVDRLLGCPEVAAASEAHGRWIVVEAVREALETFRRRIVDREPVAVTLDVVAEEVGKILSRWTGFAPKKVFNLTGVVLHTNLGRSPLPRSVQDAMLEAAGCCDLEYDLAGGRRGGRDDHVEGWICRLTGAEAAVVVNNNAAAVLLVLNTLALRREVPVSRGELVEIGGSFRMPDIMQRAGCRLREVGTTNRTHPGDFESAMSPKTALVMKVHTSNYEIRGFTTSVTERRLSEVAHGGGVPLFVDLGSGSLVDLRQFGLPHERMPQESLADGADIVSFSGDKLLGGPQAGIIAGRRDLIDRIRRNPMLRALRVDKLRLAALSAVLRLYGAPELLAEHLPALRLLTRPAADIKATVTAVRGTVEAFVGDGASVETVPTSSQIGSGALPVDSLPSWGLRIVPQSGGRRNGRAVASLAMGFRSLPRPVIGRIERSALVLDVRCLESPEVDSFCSQLRQQDIGFGTKL